VKITRLQFNKLALTAFSGGIALYFLPFLNSTEFLAKRILIQNSFSTTESIKLGSSYRIQFPDEDNEGVLMNLLFPNSSELIRALTFGFRNVFSQAIQKDFQEGRTVFIDGWTLSKTEARLFAWTSLSKS